MPKIKQTLFKTCQRCGKKVLHSLRFNNGNARYFPSLPECVNREEHDFEDKRVYLFEFDGINTPAEKKEKERKRKEKIKEIYNNLIKSTICLS